MACQLVDGTIDDGADVVVIEPQAVGLAVEVGLATHAGRQLVAGAQADAEQVGHARAVAQQQAALFADSDAAELGVEREPRSPPMRLTLCVRGQTSPGSTS